LTQLGPDIRFDALLVQEATKYLGFGIAVQMMRVLLPQFRRVIFHPAEQLQNLCRRKNFCLGMFLGGYVGVYHASIFGVFVFACSSTGILITLVNLLLHATERKGLFEPTTDFMQQNSQ
jgi:hypothetical protein